MAGPEPEPDAEPSYTVFIRLPFPRGDFVDPPPVEWGAAKDEALWEILSKSSKNSVIDWNELADKFQVTLAFLLQQAAWLYEMNLRQVHAQLTKVRTAKGSTSAAPSPVPGSTSENGGGETMRRTGSGGGGPRVSSALSGRRDTPSAGNDGAPGTPIRAMAPPFSRTTSSNNTMSASRYLPPASPRPPNTKMNRRSLSPKPKSRPPSMAIEPATRSPPPEILSSPVSSSSSDSDFEPPAQSRLLRRPARFKSKHGDPEDGDGSDDEPAFMPFAEPPHHDPSATLRGDPRNIGRRTLPIHKKPQQSQTSDSSTSSAAAPLRARPEPITRESSQRHRMTGPLSPRRTAELAGRSPISKGKGREGSDGTPSMGSSFSDLDDASVTQSALEEALMSNMQAGGMASRMSSISQALRSKYL
ncbi:hypothetical protein HYFRA_00009929 [Hymenoscyphus fraxineus]|uniref:Autophagy-related protein 29 n=1 Tax=Hymenoscyphus fraxineus TaxID=746836 RepID=A0A9N9PYE7_9HELO|nr:hypothetical protein HYFRA_00009929 [Hymenoscyphus fraxineus]